MFAKISHLTNTSSINLETLVKNKSWFIINNYAAAL